MRENLAERRPRPYVITTGLVFALTVVIAVDQSATVNIDTRQKGFAAGVRFGYAVYNRNQQIVQRTEYKTTWDQGTGVLGFRFAAPFSGTIKLLGWGDQPVGPTPDAWRMGYEESGQFTLCKGAGPGKLQAVRLGGRLYACGHEAKYRADWDSGGKRYTVRVWIDPASQKVVFAESGPQFRGAIDPSPHGELRRSVRKFPPGVFPLAEFEVLPRQWGKHRDLRTWRE